MPVLCFFNALYYTDTGSLFYVLLTYYNTLNDSSLAAGITGLVAVLFRQVRTVLGLHYCMHFDPGSSDQHRVGGRVCRLYALQTGTPQDG